MLCPTLSRSYYYMLHAGMLTGSNLSNCQTVPHIQHCCKSDQNRYFNFVNTDNSFYNTIKEGLNNGGETGNQFQQPFRICFHNVFCFSIMVYHYSLHCLNQQIPNPGKLNIHVLYLLLNLFKQYSVRPRYCKNQTQL